MSPKLFTHRSLGEAHGAQVKAQVNTESVRFSTVTCKSLLSFALTCLSFALTCAFYSLLHWRKPQPHDIPLRPALLLVALQEVEHLALQRFSVLKVEVHGVAPSGEDGGVVGG